MKFESMSDFGRQNESETQSSLSQAVWTEVFEAGKTSQSNRLLSKVSAESENAFFAPKEPEEKLNLNRPTPVIQGWGITHGIKEKEAILKPLE